MIWFHNYVCGFIIDETIQNCEYELYNNCHQMPIYVWIFLSFRTFYNRRKKKFASLKLSIIWEWRIKYSREERPFINVLVHFLRLVDLKKKLKAQKPSNRNWFRCFSKFIHIWIACHIAVKEENLKRKGYWVNLPGKECIKYRRMYTHYSLTNIIKSNWMNGNVQMNWSAFKNFITWKRYLW